MTWTAFETNGIVGWERGDGDLLALVLHGGPGLSDYTEGLADEILEGGDGRLRVVRYQQRGQQPSTTDGPLTAEQFVADVFAVVDHFGAEKALIAGHSWGGHLAMHAAVAHPDRVAALLLLDSLGAIGDGGSGTMQGVFAQRLGEEGIAKIGSLADAGLTAEELSLERLRILWPAYFADPPSAPPMPPIEVSDEVLTTLMGDASRLLGEGFLEGELPKLSIPSLHQICRHSPIEPANNERTAALMPGAIVELLDTGHFAWIEQPGSVTAATRKLLAAL